MRDHTPSDLPWRMTVKVAVDDNGCWNWTASRNSNGYGKVCIGGKTYLAHRAAYSALVGHIPSGMVIDHVCRNRGCINPRHLRPVTQGENTLAPGSLSPSAINAARTTCRLGHDLTRRGGERLCVTCTRERKRRAAAKSRKRQQDMAPELRHQLRLDVVEILGRAERLKTRDLIATLMESDEWKDRLTGRSPMQRSLWLSRSLGLRPMSHRFADGSNKGYRLADFD